ncbi:MAG: UDP-N-acetyl glucosamine 2-epimerase [Gracilibacter sp. BRH_c7a]|nr:MAG: UDP-N-acetyl glucosamine 2-epimerase [Gracilibacter sp. BRH_c7a]
MRVKKDSYKVMAVFGTRPEAIKMAPVVRAMKKQDCIECLVVVTAQHREMLDQVLNLFKIIPDFDLDLMTHGQSLSGLTSKILEGMDQILSESKPDLILVQGDTTTAFAAALAAYYHKIPIGHVEAGLRTGEKYFPWPEEINRKLAGCLADFHFAPTKVSRDNLLREGIRADKIFITGNTVIDALKSTVRDNYEFKDEKLKDILHINKEKRLIMMTTHRRENLGEPMTQIYEALKTILQEFPDTYVIFPVHKNPTVREVVDKVLGNHPRVYLIEPMDYEAFINLMSKTYLILSDSGGIQEEAPSLGKPVLVVRDTTERPEAVDAGTVDVVGTSYEKVLHGIKILMSDSIIYNKMSQAANPYGDGFASQRIAEIVVENLHNCSN